MRQLITTLLFSLLFLSSCQLSSESFQGSIIQDAQNIEAPNFELKKSDIILHLKKGRSLISLPLLSSEDASILKYSSAISQVWQKKGELISSVNDQNSYFVEVLEDTSLSWRKKDEEPYNSVILDAGINYPAIYRGENPLLLGDIKINGLTIDKAEDANIIDAFWTFNAEGEFIDLTKNYDPNLLITLTAGIVVEANAFAKISWPLSEDMQEEVDKQKEKEQKEIDKILKKKERELSKYQKQIDKRFQKMESEMAQKIFDEIEPLPLALLKAAKSKNETALSNITADRQLLAQIHPFSDITEYAEEMQTSYWFQKEKWHRPFALLDRKELWAINSVNRAVAFVNFPYTEDEVDPETGIDSFFRGIAFIRDKDCGWKFDPLETLKIEANLEREKRLFDESHLLTFLEKETLLQYENEDFTQSRLQCTPEIKGFAELKKGKFFDLDAQENQKESKMLKDHQENCEDFTAYLKDLYPDSLTEFVYNNEDEPKIQSGTFPQLSFHENICINYWTPLLAQENLDEILNDEYDLEDQRSDFYDQLKELIVEDSFYFFLGANRYFSCNKLDEQTLQNFCYFGEAMRKKSSASCRKIKSEFLQAACTSHIAQKKEHYNQCEKVYGKYDKSKDKNDYEKIVKLRNCELDVLSVTAKSKADCKQFKKRFLLFFKLSTETSKTCEDYVNRTKKLAPWKPVMQEEDVLLEMGMEE